MSASAALLVRIGGLTTHAAVESSKDLAKACSVLCECAGLIGDIQVRNRGTVGGSLAHADPAADYPTVMLALGADITVTGSRGKRKVAAEKFFVDLFTTALKRGEVLTEVSVPAMKTGQGALPMSASAALLARIGIVVPPPMAI